MKKAFSIMLGLTVLMTCFVGLTFEVNAAETTDPWLLYLLDQGGIIESGGSALSDLLGGAGTIDNPYVIDTSADFMLIREAPAACYRLVADIEVGRYSDNEEELIKFTEPFVFTGSLTGWDTANEKPTLRTVSLNIEKATNNAGLFSEYNPTAGMSISYIKTTGRVKGVASVGGIAGKGSFATVQVSINACVNRAEISGENYAGGILGDSTNLTIEYCENYGNVTGASYVGGIAGRIAYLRYSENHGKITGTSTNPIMGGLVGGSYKVIEQCYNMGEVYTTSTSTAMTPGIGGIAGVSLSNLNIESSYNFGRVSTGATYHGGILGRINIDSTKISNCYDFLSGAKNPIVTAYDTGTYGACAFANNYYVTDTDVNTDAAGGGVVKTIDELVNWSPDTEDVAKHFNLGANYKKSEYSDWQFPELKGNANTSDFRVYSVTVNVSGDGAGEFGLVDKPSSSYVLKDGSFEISVTPMMDYVGQIKVDGVFIKDVTDVSGERYALENIVKDSVISVEFVQAETPLERVVIPGGTLSVFSVPVTVTTSVTNHEKEKITLNPGDKYGAIYSKVEENFSGWELMEYGVLLWPDGSNMLASEPREALTDLTADGGYGILFYGSLSGKYHTRPYAVYKRNSDGFEHTVLGESDSFTVDE